MSDITIREAVPADCKRMCEINRTALGYDYPENKTLDRLEFILKRPSDIVFVAEYMGDIAGYVHGADYECTYCESLKNVISIAVDEKYRGLGIGRKLLEAVERWAKEDRYEGVRLTSGFARMEAHKFYLQCGYHVRKEAKNFIKLFG